jgi:hypothetical protein
MKRKSIISFTILIALTGLALVYAIGQGKKYEAPRLNNQHEKVDDEKADETGTPTGDDPWKEMEKLVVAYYNKQGMNYAGTMKLIDDNGDNEKILEEQKFSCTLLNDDYYYSLGVMEVINKKNYIIAVDHQNKTIAISANEEKNNKQSFFSINEFKKLMEERKASAKVTQLGDQKILTIDNIEDPAIQGYSIYYSPETYRIQKILIGMVRLSPLEDGNENYTDENITAGEDENKNPENTKTQEQASDTAQAEINGYYYYLEINYTNIKPLSLKEKEFNPENKFLQITKDKVELTKDYADYELNSNIPNGNKSDE